MRFDNVWILFTGFIDFMLKGKSSLEYENLFFPNKYELMINNTKIFLITKKVKINKLCCRKYRKCEKPKLLYIFDKTLVISIICSKCKNLDEKNI